MVKTTLARKEITVTAQDKRVAATISVTPAMDSIAVLAQLARKFVAADVGATTVSRGFLEPSLRVTDPALLATARTWLLRAIRHDRPS
ncbi:hypothetical protein [Streptomyces mirabilis]|uniref:hypothetical protein n=1 Tax=Streptomyces mirabilis TaxID=68239 RepID=UPI00371F225E